MGAGAKPVSSDKPRSTDGRGMSQKEMEASAASQQTRGVAGTIKLVLLFILAFVLEVIALIFDVIKTLWYIAVVAGSFAAINVPVASIDAIDQAFEDVFNLILGQGNLVSEWFREPLALIRETFAGINFVEWWKEVFAWDCAGGLKMVSWGILILICVYVYIFVGREWIFALAITSDKYIQKKNPVMRLVLTALVKVLVALAFYSVQIVVIFEYQFILMAVTSIRFSTFEDLTTAPAEAVAVRGGCDDIPYDAELSILADVLIIITTAGIVLWYLSLFAGRSGGKPLLLVGSLLAAPFTLFFGWKPCTNRPKPNQDGIRPFCLKIGWGKWFANLWIQIAVSLYRLVFLTFGVWTSDMAGPAAFAIAPLADEYDDDPFDDDNKHLTVIQIFGKSRGVLWAAFPGMLVLTKVAEFLNHPALFIFAKDGRVEPKDGWLKRGFRWFWNVSRLVLTVVVVFFPLLSTLIPLLTVLIPPALLNLYESFEDATKKVKKRALSPEELKKWREEMQKRRVRAAEYEARRTGKSTQDVLNEWDAKDKADAQEGKKATTVGNAAAYRQLKEINKHAMDKDGPGERDASTGSYYGSDHYSAGASDASSRSSYQSYQSSTYDSSSAAYSYSD